MGHKQITALAHFSQAINDAYDNYEWGQNDFSHELDVSQATLSRWLSGVNIPSANEIVRIARVLRVSPKRFLPNV